MKKTRLISVPFEQATNDTGAINPFQRIVYECTTPDGNTTYYNDEALTNIADDIHFTAPMTYIDPVMLYGPLYQAPVPIAAKDIPSKPLSPFDYAKEFLNTIPTIIFNQTHFIFSDGCYHETTAATMRCLIMRVCGNSIIQTGNPCLVDRILYAISIFPEIQRREHDILPNLIPFANGLLDLTTMQLLPPNPNLFITYCVPINYDPCARNCPIFMDFLNTVTVGYLPLQTRILEIIGYLLSQGNDAKKFFVFAGYGDSGKSVLIRLIESLITEDSLFSASMNDFGKRFTMGYMTNVHLSTFGDMPRNPITAEAIGKIKSITGGDAIYSEKKHQDPHRLRATTKLLFSTNHELLLEYEDLQFMNRCCIVPFMKQIPPEAQDRLLSEKMLSERAAIANLAIEAYRQMLFRCEVTALEFSGEAEAMALYRQYAENQRTQIIDDSSIYADFIRSCCILDETARIHTEKLYLAYTRYCAEHGFSPDSLKSFSRRFRDCVPFLQDGKWRESGDCPKNGYIGITLRQEYLS